MGGEVQDDLSEQGIIFAGVIDGGSDQRRGPDRGEGAVEDVLHEVVAIVGHRGVGGERHGQQDGRDQDQEQPRSGERAQERGAVGYSFVHAAIQCE